MSFQCAYCQASLPSLDSQCGNCKEIRAAREVQAKRLALYEAMLEGQVQMRSTLERAVAAIERLAKTLEYFRKRQRSVDGYGEDGA